MKRWLVCAVAAATVLGAAGEAWASPGWSGPGWYLSLGKLISVLVVFLLWVGTTDWVSRDALSVRMNHLQWNPIVFGSFMLAIVLLWYIPYFWLGFPLLLAAYVAPLTTYILIRNRRVESHQKVLTPAHLRYWLAQQLGALGIKMKAELEDPHVAGAPVVLAARGGPTERDETARTLAARQTPGFLQARKLISEALTRRADMLTVDFSASAVTVRHLIDGVWQPGTALDRESGDPMIEAIKVLCALNPKDRQNRQEGKLLVEYSVLRRVVFEQLEKLKESYKKKLLMDLAKELASPELTEAALAQKVKSTAEQRTREYFVSDIGPWTPMTDDDVNRVKHLGQLNPAAVLEKVKALGNLVTQGIPAGERLVIQFEGKKIRFASLEELGMRAKMQEQWGELIERKQGLLVISALPAAGMRTTIDVVLRSADRFTREFMAIQEENDRYEAVENVPVTTYKAAEGQSPADLLDKVFHQEPQVLVVRDLVNVQTLQGMLQEIPNGRLMITSIRARDSVEAVYRLLAMGVRPAEMAGALVGVLNQRLVRKLCEYCREAYAPPANVAAQLGIPPGRAVTLYRPPSPPRADEKEKEVCPECGGLGYRGRTAIFELLAINEAAAKVLAAGAKPDVLRQAARANGMRNFQEEGLLAVLKGVTSLQELMRVLKEQSATQK